MYELRPMSQLFVLIMSGIGVAIGVATVRFGRTLFCVEEDRPGIMWDVAVAFLVVAGMVWFRPLG